MQSWVSDKLIIKGSKKHGLGLFTRIALEQNELIIIFGGYVDTKPVEDGYFLQLKPGFYLNNSLSHPKEDLSNFLNHSCEPNTMIRDLICVYTSSHINEGDEITMDYFFNLDISLFPDFTCNCGTPSCKFKK